MYLRQEYKFYINVFGKSLEVFHYGCIVVNNSAQFRDYCVIYIEVNVSANVTDGDYVYLAPKAKINKNQTIAIHTILGSNCVKKSVAEELTT